MYYFIVNPDARCGRGIRIWKRMEKMLNSEGIKYLVYLTEKPGDAKKLARELTEGCKSPCLVVAVGGDGTVNEVLNGISFSSQVTLGYIPAGSGNDLARSLKLPKSPARCMKKVLHPKYYRLLDYGIISYGEKEISYRRFMVSAGIGMDAAVCHDLMYSKLKKALNRVYLGKLTYIMTGIKQSVLAKPAKGYLLLDGVRKVEFNHIYFISAHIHPYEGGGFNFAPKAADDDGRLSVCVMNHASRRRLVYVLTASLRRKPPNVKGIRVYNCREVVIHMERPMAVHVDGESCFCQKDIQIGCVRKKVRMIV